LEARQAISSLRRLVGSQTSNPTTLTGLCGRFRTYLVINARHLKRARLSHWERVV
jgi:hypothetical protein